MSEEQPDTLDNNNSAASLRVQQNATQHNEKQVSFLDEFEK